MEVQECGINKIIRKMALLPFKDLISIAADKITLRIKNASTYTQAYIRMNVISIFIIQADVLVL